MRSQQRISIMTAVLTVVFFSLPSWAQRVETDYDHSVNFSQYHTYSWGHVHSTDPFFEDRIRAAVDRELQSKGWRLDATGGDVMLTAVLIAKNQPEYTTFYDGLGGRWGWHGWGTGMATTTIEKIPIGTLIVDIYDCSSEHLVWRGLAHDQLSEKPDKDTKKLDKAVAKMFAKFPPQTMYGLSMRNKPFHLPGASLQSLR
jgi:Domain of unknown function (DUF4136)